MDTRDSSSAMTGTLSSIHAKPRTAGERGIPKISVDEAWIDFGGVRGDFNVARHEKLRGDPERAVLLLARETLADLAAEGWPVRPGDLGENLLTVALHFEDFGRAHPVVVGGARLELTKEATPCAKLALLPYVGVERLAAFVATLVGRRGWYARVRDPGPVKRGDRIEVSAEPCRAEEASDRWA